MSGLQCLMGNCKRHAKVLGCALAALLTGASLTNSRRRTSGQGRRSSREYHELMQDKESTPMTACSLHGISWMASNDQRHFAQLTRLCSGMCCTAFE